MAHIEVGIKIKPANVGQWFYATNPSTRILFEYAPSELEEDGIRIALTVVDTPGFGDNIDNEHASVSLF